MSKGISGLFKGTSGSIAQNLLLGQNLIALRVAGLDLREHPRNKALSAKKRKEISSKIQNRTATRAEYKQLSSDRRFSIRRQEGVNQFWVQEQMRILHGLQTTRNWSNEQRAAIIQSKRPKVNGKTVQGHHAYSASKYPHLANQGAVIFPVTFKEHLYGWHGGNFRNSLPGQPFKQQLYYSFEEGDHRL